jgi:hypothetical protein
MITVIAKIPLLRKSVQYAFADGSQKCKLRALFDGGSSNCFARLSCLPSQLQKIVNNFDAGKVLLAINVSIFYENIQSY